METYEYNRRCGCQRCTATRMTGPALMITLGVLFLIDELTVRVGFRSTWPVLLIVIGAVQFFSRGGSMAGHRNPVLVPPAAPVEAVAPPAATTGSEVQHG